MTPSGIEPATIRFVAQHLNHCATAVPDLLVMSVLFCDRFSIINISRLREIFYWLLGSTAVAGEPG